MCLKTKIKKREGRKKKLLQAIFRVLIAYLIPKNLLAEPSFCPSSSGERNSIIIFIIPIKKHNNAPGIFKALLFCVQL
jgi:hypothetical protein